MPLFSNMFRAPEGTPLPPGHSDQDPCPGGRHWVGDDDDELTIENGQPDA